ncbi:hypothetical protein CHS0354_033785, partial [Potamilus streckersoni]
MELFSLQYGNDLREYSPVIFRDPTKPIDFVSLEDTIPITYVIIINSLSTGVHNPPEKYPPPNYELIAKSPTKKAIGCEISKISKLTTSTSQIEQASNNTRL